MEAYKGNWKHELSVNVFFYIMQRTKDQHHRLCSLNLTDNLFYAKQIEHSKSWPDPDYVFVSRRRLQKAEMIAYITNGEICLSPRFHQSRASRLPLRVAPGGLCLPRAVVMPGCERTFPPRQIQSEPQGKVTPGLQHRRQDIKWRMCIHSVLLFEYATTWLCFLFTLWPPRPLGLFISSVAPWAGPAQNKGPRISFFN